jgi:PAS domain S-box-containing protein
VSSAPIIEPVADAGGPAEQPDPFFDLAEDPCCILGLEDGAFIRVNRAWTEAFGWPAAQLTGQLLAGLAHPDDRPALTAALRAAGGGAGDERVVARLRGSHGNHLEVAWKLRGSDTVLFVTGRLRDEVPVEQELVDFVFGAVGAGVCRVSADGRIAGVNDRYVELVGVPRDELVGSFPPQAGADPLERSDTLDVAAAARNGEARRAARDLTCGDGLRRRFELVGLPLPGPANARADALVAIRGLEREHAVAQELESSGRWLRDLAAVAGQAVWIGDAAGDAEWIDPRLTRMVGVPAEALLARSFETLVPVALRGQVRAALDGARRERVTREIETRLASSDGAEMAVVVRFHPVPDEHGRHSAVVATVARVGSGRRDDEQSSTQTDLLDVLGAAVMALDKRGRIVHWNEAARRLSGFTRADAEGQPGMALLMPDTAPADTRVMLDALRDARLWQGTVAMRRKDGLSIPVHVHVVRPASSRGSLSAVAVAIDMSEHKETESRLEDARGYLSAVVNSMAEGLFALTPDARIAYMNENAEKMLGWRLSEVKGRYMHATVHYQRADGSGYPAHDCPMVRAAKNGQTTSAKEDHLTRKDGSLVPVEWTATPIRTARGSRGTVVLVRDISHRPADRQRAENELEGLAWVSRIRDALDNDRLILYAQPIVDVATRSAVQHELLLRMLVDGEVVAPGEFLPHAESHGLIGQIDRWVVMQGANLAAAGRTVQINLSAQTISDATIAGDVERILRESGADPANVVFEITEKALHEQEEAAHAFADAMHRIGCELALDDFGTRYGGFKYLKRLPVRYLKIDNEFVGDLLEDESSVHVVSAVVDLAHAFGHKTVAEGVEDEATLDRLRSLGVDLAQGYLLGRPAPVRDVLGR